MRMTIEDIKNEVQEREDEILDRDEEDMTVRVSYDSIEFADLRERVVTNHSETINYDVGNYTGQSLYGLIPFYEGKMCYANGITIEHKNYAPEYFSNGNPLYMIEDHNYFDGVDFDLHGAEEAGEDFFQTPRIGNRFHDGINELFTSFPYGYPKFPDMLFDKITMPDGTIYLDVAFSVDGESESYYKVAHGSGYQVSGFSDFGVIGLGYPAEDHMIDELKAIVRDRRAYGEYHCGALEGYADSPDNYLKGHIMFHDGSIFEGHFLCPDNGQFLEDKKVIETVILKGHYFDNRDWCRSQEPNRLNLSLFRWKEVTFNKKGKKRILNKKTLSIVEHRRSKGWGEECIVFEDELAC